MLMYILLAVVAVIAVILVLAMTKPSTFEVVRRATIKAPAEKLFPLVNDFHGWAAWSPWEELDPTMQRTFTGPASGLGAAYAWQGNKKVGSGRMEITGETRPTNVTIKLDFITPWEGHNVTVFSFTPVADGTEVTWTMTGPTNFMWKVMSVFMNMGDMIGKDFDKGLAKMKRVGEG
ncbi:MAG: SRPBCC family protein [Gemmatimonadetes bacterium]|nr:SRPBCC family protein [Gemmatimonadota bacterium]